MRINRMSIAAGLTVGLLAGGAGGAIAATTSGSNTARTSSTTTSMAPDRWDRYGFGWGGDGTAWRDPATAVGWDARHGEPAGPMASDGW